MANVDKMETIFNDVLKKFESAAKSREWNNAARGNEFDRNISNVEQEKAAFAKRFAAAKAEVVAP